MLCLKKLCFFLLPKINFTPSTSPVVWLPSMRCIQPFFLTLPIHFLLNLFRKDSPPKKELKPICENLQVWHFLILLLYSDHHFRTQLERLLKWLCFHLTAFLDVTEPKNNNPPCYQLSVLGLPENSKIIISNWYRNTYIFWTHTVWNV